MTLIRNFLSCTLCDLFLFLLLTAVFNFLPSAVFAQQVVPRLSVHGAQIVDSTGAPILLRGFNWNEYARPEDAAANVAQGANVVRLALSWHVDGTKTCTAPFPNTKFDAYAPGRPGNLDSSLLAALDTRINWATSRGLWVDLVIRGGACDFWTNSAITGEFVKTWVFLANRYKKTPYIGMYELLAEPKPTDDRNDNKAVKALYETIIAAIRRTDAVTPIMVGPAPIYNIRNSNEVFMPGQHNIIYTANFYELKAFVKQTKGGLVPVGGYPGNYEDDNVGQTSCQYPGKRSTTIYMDKIWLSGLVRCLTELRAVWNVPIFVQQVGIRSGVPDSKQWAGDVLDILNTNNIGWAYWVYRSPHGEKASNLLANGIGVVWQDANGAWHPKMDWLNLLSARMRTPPRGSGR